MRRIRQGLLAALPLAIGVLIAAVVAGGGPPAQAGHCPEKDKPENDDGGGTTPTFPTEVDLRAPAAPTGTAARRCRHNDDDDDEADEELAELAVFQSATPDPVRAGEFLTYTITVRNGGSVTAGAVQVVMSLGAGGRIASSQLPGNCTSGGGSATCQLGSLGDGASASVQIVVIPNAAGVLTNQVTATSPDASGQAVTGGSVTVQSFTPTQGVNFGGTVTSGTIYVQPPRSSSFYLASGGAILTFGTIINATQGSILLTTSNTNATPLKARGRGPTAAASALNRAEFSGGVFRITQDKSPNAPTDLKLVGGDFSSCPRGPSSPARLSAGSPWAGAAAAPSRRRLWGRGRGRFRTRGRYGAATVRGTHWLTIDRCDGTLFVAREGSLTVRDLVRRRTLTLRAPRSHLVRAPIRER